MTKILVVEDEEPIRMGLKDNLEMEGYEVYDAEDGDQALAIAGTMHPDLVLLDLMLPGKSGFEICRSLRRKHPSTHIIMLTAKGEEASKVTGLEMGADDYVTKPFSLLELLARIRSALRRKEQSPAQATKGSAEETLVFDDVEIDFKKFTAKKTGKAVDLNPREYQILRFMAKKAGEVVTREDLLEHVWGYSVENMPTTRTIDNHIVRIRQKLENDPANPNRILSVRGIGYKLDV